MNRIPLVLLLLGACVAETPVAEHAALRAGASDLRIDAAAGTCAYAVVELEAAGDVEVAFGEAVPPCPGLVTPVGSLAMPDRSLAEVTIGWCPPADIAVGSSCATSLPLAWTGPESAGEVVLAITAVAVPWDPDGDGVAGSGDCEPYDPTAWPGAPEIPDGVDDDCDGTVDEGTGWYDDDGDGWSEWEGDCDDADPGRSPGAVEAIDGVDDDCNGRIDDHTDAFDDDGDGFREGDGDCNDLDPAVHPLAGEFAPPLYAPDGVDNDCDGEIDEVQP